MNADIVKQFIKNAIGEDVGDGDHTSLSTIPKTTEGKAKLMVKQAGIIAGVELAVAIFAEVDCGLKVDVFIKDGEKVSIGDIVLKVRGAAHSILLAERLVLNCMQRMSGIATKTRNIVEMLKPFHTQALDTRKTTPGLRYFEKLAVKIGGGINHRMGLYDMILIKDNHIDYAGGIKKAINSANAYLERKQKNIEIEIEVRNLDELGEVLEIGRVNRIMLDNFSIPILKEAIQLIGGEFLTEASGGITEDNLIGYASTGVDYISMGALTHSVKCLDLSLKAI